MRSALAHVMSRILWGTAAALFGILLLSLAAIDHVRVPLAACLVLALVSGLRPAQGLTITAVLVPIATWIGRTWDGSLAWPEAVAVAFLLGYAGRQAVQKPGEQADALTIAIHVTIAIVVASLGVQLLLLHGTIGVESLGDFLSTLAAGGYFVGNSGLAGLDAGMRLIEGLLLAHAGSSLARADRAVAPRIIRAVVIGAAAAAALNVWRIWLGALRLDSPVVEFLRLLATLRFNTHYGDVNAAGSYFLMALLPALALTRAVSSWRWIVPALLIAVSLVLSGSRAAILAGMVAAGTIWLITQRRAHRMPGRIGVVPTLLISAAIAVAGVGVSYLALQRNLTPATTALLVRAEYTRISFAMLATRPIFGIGTGQYPARLPEFVTPQLMALYPVLRENAHNNFLQILAELGVAGFAASLFVLGIATARMLPLWRTGPSTTIERSACAGLFAFVLTWLFGHPLLTDAPALSFWLLLGAVAGCGTAIGSTGLSEDRVRNRVTVQTGWRGWVAAGLIIAPMASIPARARQELGEANLEHIGIGVSQWQPEKNGLEYRLAGRSSIVFVPSSAAVVEIPLRAAQTERELHVELYLDGRPADVVTVRHDAWYTVVLQVPRRGSERRFRALELRVIDGPADVVADQLMIGKVHPRGS